MNDDSIIEYQKWTRVYWKDMPEKERMCHALIGLAGESGEVCDLLKKKLFAEFRIKEMYKDAEFPEAAFKADLGYEIGDVLYYLTRIADENNILMSDVIFKNRMKLEVRYGQRS